MTPTTPQHDIESYKNLKEEKWMSDETFTALLEMEKAGMILTGGSKLLEYEERKQKAEDETEEPKS